MSDDSGTEARQADSGGSSGNSRSNSGSRNRNQSKGNQSGSRNQRDRTSGSNSGSGNSGSGNSGSGSNRDSGRDSDSARNQDAGEAGGGTRRRRRGRTDGDGGVAAGADGKPRIGDTRPAPKGDDRDGSGDAGQDGGGESGTNSGRNRNRGGSGSQNNSNKKNADSGGSGNSGGQGRNGNRQKQNQSGQNKSGQNKSSQNKSGSGRNKSGNKNQDGQNQDAQNQGGQNNQGGQDKPKRRRGGRGRGRGKTVQGGVGIESVELDEETLALRRGKQRDGKNIGRYMMAVRVQDHARHIAILEGRNLIEYYVSRPTDDATQIHGNIYLGRVQNVLPGMEAAFIDIGTPKNAVLYHGDIQYDAKEFGKRPPRIEQVLKARKMILCQVTKNPIAHKGARLTQEVSLPGRFVVLVPNSTTYGISKRLPDKERKRLRGILDSVKPKEHGVIVRTAAENVTEEELQRDVSRLLNQWESINEQAQNTQGGPRLLYREPDLAVRLIREEFTKEYRSVIIDDQTLFEEVYGYVSSITPALSDRIEHYDIEKEKLGLWERHHVHEQLLKALDKKVWLPSGGSLIIEHTEALTVIDVNTGKNVGKSNLEDTVYRNNLEAAREVARQLRLRDIGGIIVIDFVDMENRKNRARVTEVFREELARDKTRTQVYEISDLGLVEMTRKRIGEGLLESMSHTCEICAGSGAELEADLMENL